MFGGAGREEALSGRAREESKWQTGQWLKYPPEEDCPTEADKRLGCIESRLRGREARKWQFSLSDCNLDGIESID